MMNEVRAIVGGARGAKRAARGGTRAALAVARVRTAPPKLRLRYTEVKEDFLSAHL